MGFIGFSVWSTYQVLFFVALAIIFIMCIIIGIQSAKAADRKCVGLLKLAVLVFLFYEGDKLIKKLKRNNRYKTTTPSE